MFFLSSINGILPYSIILLGWVTVGFYYLFPTNDTSEEIHTISQIHQTISNSDKRNISFPTKLFFDYYSLSKQNIHKQSQPIAKNTDLYNTIDLVKLRKAYHRPLFAIRHTFYIDLHLRRGPPFFIL